MHVSRVLQAVLEQLLEYKHFKSFLKEFVVRLSSDCN